MNPKRTVSEEDLARLQAARAEKDTAERNWRAVVVDVANGSSTRAAAKAAHLSPDTVDRWRNGR